MSNNQAGKGPEMRKGANLNAYWNNYDAIFRKKSKKKISEQDVEEMKIAEDSMSHSEWKKIINR